MIKPGIPQWAVWGDEAHRGNLISSIRLDETDLEEFNVELNAKYDRMIENEQRADLYRCDDAEVLFVASNTPARMVKGAIQVLRDQGVKAGLFRPVTLWPFPIKDLTPLLDRVKRIVVVEASAGQLEDELRLAIAKAGVDHVPPIEHVRRMGGNLPQMDEIVGAVGLEEEVQA
jgi:pyruvate/2-oxoacid:ferredoxin oxidoreductase alpha subunit